MSYGSSKTERHAWKSKKVDPKKCDHRNIYVEGIVPYFYYPGSEARDRKKVPIIEWGDCTHYTRNKARAIKVYCVNCERDLTYEEAKEKGIVLYDIPERFKTKRRLKQ